MHANFLLHRRWVHTHMRPHTYKHTHTHTHTHTYIHTHTHTPAHTHLQFLAQGWCMELHAILTWITRILCVHITTKKILEFIPKKYPSIFTKILDLFSSAWSKDDVWYYMNSSFAPHLDDSPCVTRWKWSDVDDDWQQVPCVCMCLGQRGRGRGGKGEKEKARARARETERKSICVLCQSVCLSVCLCMCPCVCLSI